MSSPSGSSDFTKLFINSPKELYSERFYYAMDRNTEDLKDFNVICNQIYVNDHKDQMILICEKYLRFLNKSESWSNLFSDYDVSLLLNYWIYDKLTHIYGDKNTKEIDIGFGVLQGKWSAFERSIRNTSYYKNCWPDPSKVYHEDWKNRKKLYDYYVDYDILFGSAKTIDTFCKKYYEKIKGFYSLYKDFQGKCTTQGPNCPEFFHKFDKKDLSYKLENLPCYTEMEQALGAAKTKDRLSPNHSGSEPGQRATGDGYRSPGSELGNPQPETTTETSGIGKGVTHTVLGAAPVLLTATALYRYTPFGSWIRKLRGGHTNSMSVMGEVPSYMQETGDVFSDHEANYISYEPM
ncbi:unnamed protein product [Plasmodium vivax]|uniref:(malaria parasite P. vivax) hypothetical protein n=1 Tax=Plasmodium vivax TaxID=5855 RepID=A0A8S4HA81_PLAVI|nr:unnamed protein product [Plasmodium vivax]